MIVEPLWPNVPVERAVRQVARERDVLVGAAGNDDPAVGLDDDRAGVVCPRAEVGGDDAARAEARVERPVGVVADEREVAVDARGADREPGGHDLAVGLNGDGVGLGALAEDPGPDDPARAEAGSSVPSGR